MPIAFYVKGDSYGDFSNFSDHGIEMDGKWYSTVEHYFQAMKFPGHQQSEKIRLATSPMVAKKWGNVRSVALRDDWEAVKLDVMRAAVRKKMATHPEVAQLLLETEDEELIEAAPSDYFWGCGKSGSGQNWLGRILMEVRTELRRGS